MLGESRQTDSLEREEATSDTKGKSVNIPTLRGCVLQRGVLQRAGFPSRGCKAASQAEDLFGGIQKSFLFSLSVCLLYLSFEGDLLSEKGGGALKELDLGSDLVSEKVLFHCKGRKTFKVSADTPARTTWKIQWSVYKSKDYLPSPRIVPETASGSRFQEKLD